jgi:hypothetical protein
LACRNGLEDAGFAREGREKPVEEVTLPVLTVGGSRFAFTIEGFGVSSRARMLDFRDFFHWPDFIPRNGRFVVNGIEVSVLRSIERALRNGADLSLMEVEPLPDSIPLLGDTRSQPYVPIQAAKALVKTACSLCPKQELDQCRGAIDWVRGRRQQNFGSFPVLFAFTPGTFDERVSHVVVLRRKDEGPEPFLWCVVQFRNYRFQVFVPFCSADAHWHGKRDAPATRFEHYPSMLPPDWPKGPTQFHWFNWAGTETERTSWNVSHHMEKLISITRPTGVATETEATITQHTVPRCYLLGSARPIDFNVSLKRESNASALVPIRKSSIGVLSSPLGFRSSPLTSTATDFLAVTPGFATRSRSSMLIAG